jgi:hypothetical protein
MASKGRHVGVGVAELRARLGPRDRRACAFASQQVADAVLDEMTNRFAGRIQAWLRGGAGLDLDLHYAPALPAGVVVTREQVLPGTRVLAVLRKSRAQAGYTVVVAYPLPARTTDVARLEHLGSFFAAYFHQDWPLGDPPPQRLIDRFARAAPPRTLDAVVSEIDRLLFRFKDQDELRAVLDDLDLEYDPMADGITTRSWLFALRETLSTPMAPGVTRTPA